MLKTSLLPSAALMTVGRTSHRFQIHSEAHDCTESHEPWLYTGIWRPGFVSEWVSQWCSKVSMKHLTSRDVFSSAGLLMAAVCFTDSSRGAQKHDLVRFFFLFLSAYSFQTCRFHCGYCSFLQQIPLTWRGLQQGSKHPTEQFSGRVEQFLSCRTTAFTSCCWTAGSSNCSFIPHPGSKRESLEKGRIFLGWGGLG